MPHIATCLLLLSKHDSIAIRLLTVHHRTRREEAAGAEAVEPEEEVDFR
jgi:hypothetical protein